MIAEKIKPQSAQKRFKEHKEKGLHKETLWPLRKSLWSSWSRAYPTYFPIIAILCFLFSLPNQSYSQEIQNQAEPISLTETLQISKENQPLLQSEKLKIDRAEAIGKSAWDFGQTQVFTGGEELGGENPGTFTTIGIKQQGIDLFGIVPKNKLNQQKTELAEANYKLFALQWELRVKKAWANAFVAKRKLNLLKKLDSVYGEFLKAANLKYDVESISQLELLTAQNTVNQIKVQKKQAQSDYQNALEKLNLFLGNESKFTVPNELPPGLILAKKEFSQKLETHPLLKIQQEKIELAEAEKQLSRAEFLPEISLQYGLQEINGQDGFYNYEIGIAVPLFSGPNYAEAKTTKIEQQIVERKSEFVKKQFQTNYRQALQNFKKWKNSWKFFKEKSLPILKKQRSGSLLAYREGALDYFALIQNLDAAFSIEINALGSLENYLFALFELQFYTLNP